LALVVIGGVLYYRMGNRSDTSEEVKKEIMAFLPKVKDYAKHKTKLNQWADDAHRQAFNEAYDMGGRRRSATFDEDKYVSTFFEVLCKRAQTAGLRDLENNLRTLAVEYDNAVAAAARPK
jgi:hypothetical protein